MAQVKICGIKDEDMLRSAARAGADWVGFVMVPASPRNILGEGPGSSDLYYDLLFAAAEAEMRTAALISDADDRTLRILSGAVMPDAIQLHGSESPEEVARMRAAAPPSIEIWKAIGVRDQSDLAQCDAYEAADRLLIDAKAPEGAAYSGGHGMPFDWAILKNWNAPRPWFLAGGLTAGNVQEAITATGATAVDVSSGVESARGVKDAALIDAFIKAAKAA